MVSDKKYRLLVEERDLVFYIDEHEALRLTSDGKIFVWGDFALENLDVVKRLRKCFIDGAVGEDIPVAKGPVKIREDN